MSIETLSYDNPPFPKWKFISFIFFISPILVCFIAWAGFGFPWRGIIVLLIGAFIGGFLGISMAFRTFFWSPCKVEITTEKVVLLFRNGEKKDVKWGEIETLFIGTKEPYGLFQAPRESILKVKNDFRPRVISYEIAQTIKSKR